MTVLVVYLPLLLMGYPLKSYDTNFHIFYSSHYVHHWFNPWNPKCYAGFPAGRDDRPHPTRVFPSSTRLSINRKKNRELIKSDLLM